MSPDPDPAAVYGESGPTPVIQADEGQGEQQQARRRLGKVKPSLTILEGSSLERPGDQQPSEQHQRHHATAVDPGPVLPGHQAAFDLREGPTHEDESPEHVAPVTGDDHEGESPAAVGGPAFDLREGPTADKAAAATSLNAPTQSEEVISPQAEHHVTTVVVGEQHHVNSLYELVRCLPASPSLAGACMN